MQMTTKQQQVWQIRARSQSLHSTNGSKTVTNCQSVSNEAALSLQNQCKRHLNIYKCDKYAKKDYTVCKIKHKGPLETLKNELKYDIKFKKKPDKWTCKVAKIKSP